MMELVKQTVLYTVSIAFLTGLLLTSITGSARSVKILLAALTTLAVVGLVIGLIISRGLLIYLLFQVIALMIGLYFVVIIGAVCGGGVYALLNKRQIGKQLGEAELAGYMPLAEFCAREGIDEESATVRLTSSFYAGGRYNGNWYVHRNELTDK
jgi:hypothetical protein